MQADEDSVPPAIHRFNQPGQSPLLPGAVEEVGDERRDLRQMIFEGEVAGVEEVSSASGRSRV
ncbi:hypothetical protein [Micromonospora psammae]|uniref:hypothetical protein n=1 Tax=Micromonospora sp. CPCC 205556 TaxID=3122398 RepID=UPI002FEEDE7A